MISILCRTYDLINAFDWPIGAVTRQWTNGPWFESGQGQNIFLFSKTCRSTLGPTQPCNEYWGPFAEVKKPNVLLNTHFLLALRLRIANEATPPLPLYVLRRGQRKLYLLPSNTFSSDKSVSVNTQTFTAKCAHRTEFLGDRLQNPDVHATGHNSPSLYPWPQQLTYFTPVSQTHI
jgi:hypothetical protein